MDGPFRLETPGRSGTADTKALDLVYAEFAHEGYLLIGFNPFDQDFVAAISDQGNNVLEHRLAPRSAAVVKKRAVNLHRIEID